MCVSEIKRIEWTCVERIGLAREWKELYQGSRTYSLATQHCESYMGWPTSDIIMRDFQILWPKILTGLEAVFGVIRQSAPWRYLDSGGKFSMRWGISLMSVHRTKALEKNTSSPASEGILLASTARHPVATAFIRSILRWASDVVWL